MVKQIQMQRVYSLPGREGDLTINFFLLVTDIINANQLKEMVFKQKYGEGC